MKAFLSKKDATKQNSFIYKLTETTMFANFIEVQFLDGPEKQELLYFSKLISQERTKAQPTVIVPFSPLKTTRSYPPNAQDIESSSNECDSHLPVNRGVPVHCIPEDECEGVRGQQTDRAA